MKLIFFEGIAGSGKTTTAEHVGTYLSSQNIYNRVLKEIDEDNPFVLRKAESDGDAFCVRARRNWAEFIENRVDEYPVWLMDGTLLQHTTNALVFLDYPRDQIQRHILAIVEKLKPYDPKLIYFHGDDVKTEVKRVIDERGDLWIDKNKGIYQDSPFAKRHMDDPIGAFYDFFEEIVAFYEIMLDQLPLEVLRINKSQLKWEDYEKEIFHFTRE
jgi:adenylate kinase family enzyme